MIFSDVSLYKHGQRGTNRCGNLHTHTGIYSIVCELSSRLRSVTNSPRSSYADNVCTERAWSKCRDHLYLSPVFRRESAFYMLSSQYILTWYQIDHPCTFDILTSGTGCFGWRLRCYRAYHQIFNSRRTRWPLLDQREPWTRSWRRRWFYMGTRWQAFWRSWGAFGQFRDSWRHVFNV